MALRRVGQLFVRAGSNFVDDSCWRLAASLSYAAVFSIFPLLLLCAGTLGFVLGDDDSVRQRLVALFSDLLTPTSRPLLDETLHSLQTHRGARGVGVLVGAITLLFGASGVFSELQASLDTIWRVPPLKHASTWPAVVAAVRDRGMAFLIVAGAAMLLLASLAASSILSSLAHSELGVNGDAAFWRAMEMAASIVLQTALLATLFRVIPHARVRWSDVLGGSLLTSITLTLLKIAMDHYLSGIGSYAAYGAVGAVLALLLWVYLAAMVFFYGAEVCHSYATEFGSLRQRSVATTGAELRGQCRVSDAA